MLVADDDSTSAPVAPCNEHTLGTYNTKRSASAEKYELKSHSTPGALVRWVLQIIETAPTHVDTLQSQTWLMGRNTIIINIVVNNKLPA